MKALLSRIHARVGDLWWYSAMIFLACRSGDAIQAFIGLWLVPKYVGPQELGAVLPLQQLTSFLTVPLAIVAVVFSKYVNTYATRGEYGKVKSFIHDVFTCSFILFIVCIAGAYLVMPFFYERLKIASGSLTFLILLCGLFTNIGAIVGSAQQGLKRFKTMALMNFLSAPIRLITMLVAMPFRALSGYILGQTTPAATTSLLSAFDIHRALKPYTPDTSWRKDWKSILNYTWPIAINLTITSICGTACYTVYRQRLPEVESSAFYLITRFAEIAGYIGGAISVVLFPLVSEAHENKSDASKLVCKTSLFLFIVILTLTAFAAITHNLIFDLSEMWSAYKPYSHLLPVITFYTGCGVIITNFITYEIACRRFGAMFWLLASTVAWNTFLVTFTGAEFFRGILPDSIVDWVVSVHAARLDFLSYLTIPLLFLQLVVTLLIFCRNRRKIRS